MTQEADPDKNVGEDVIELSREEEAPDLGAHAAAIEARECIAQSIDRAEQIYDDLQGLQVPSY